MFKIICARYFLFILGLLSISFNIYSQQLDQALQKVLLETPQGHIAELPSFLQQDIRSLTYEKTVLPGPQYIISDDPEYIRVPEALALQEKIKPGTVRLYVYNVNGVKEPTKITRKITAVLKNTGSSTMRVRMLKYSSQKPSTNYYHIGKQGLSDYFDSEPDTKSRKVKPGRAIAIDEILEKHKVNYNELVHGFYEFVVDQPGEVSIIQTSPEQSGPDALKTITNILPPKSHSGAGRGMFGVSNYFIKTSGSYSTSEGPVQIIVADGKTDPWVKGREGSTDNPATLAGNYGVIYEIEMKWKSDDKKGLALVTWNSNSENGKWCGGMTTSMKVSEGKFKEGIVQLPSNELTTKGAPQAVLAQIFLPENGAEEQTIRLTYSPPGASCLPTPLIFIPVNLD